MADKAAYTEAFGAANAKFSFYQNSYTGQQDVVDYKDWIVGLGRRNNALKLYYGLSHYGIKRLVASIEDLQQKNDYFIDLVRS